MAAKISDKKAGPPLAVTFIALSLGMSVYLAALRPIPGLRGLDIYAEIRTLQDLSRNSIYPPLSAKYPEETQIHYTEALGNDVLVSIKMWSTRNEELWLYGECQVLEGREKFQSIMVTATPWLIRKYEPDLANERYGVFGCTVYGLKSPGTIRLHLSYNLYDPDMNLLTKGTREVIIHVVEK